MSSIFLFSCGYILCSIIFYLFIMYKINYILEIWKKGTSVIGECITFVRKYIPKAKIEARLDSAFFSDEIVHCFRKLKVEFSITVPFERFVELKTKVELRKKWKLIDENHGYFEFQWSPKSWSYKYGH